ncbi:DUF4145 domain-containing protein [Roseivivax sp. THAF197b]|uniref:DUF4145 domain-containing protein n=1 Tax=Roseivivax sp. THAF197b TaxID=2588299 RepID=UPI001267D33F|nr:DUF4145 domain-containing protein [Roseivivax sp. THAF197b]QFS82350.1 hypothetical protein FIV09_05880 [Roseivivax sp. THAF197b]
MPTPTPEFRLENPNILQADTHISEIQTHEIPRAPIRCPHCHTSSVFSVLRTPVQYQKATINSEGRKLTEPVKVAIRQCPNESCRGIVLYLLYSDNLESILPPERIGFSTENIPERLVSTLQEAITCHANGAFRASAMMVRRLLEELCDLNDADGKNLHDRLTALQEQVILPPALFEAMSHLKALGNDAAHIKAKNYSSVGAEESKLSIELAQEILKARYQYDDLVNRLRARQNDAARE